MKKSRIILFFSVLLLVVILLVLFVVNIYLDGFIYIFFIVLPLLGILTAIVFLREKYDNSIIDFNKDKTYFRDLIKQYNPTVLTVVYKLAPKYPILLMVGLLELEKKGKIKIKNGIEINEELMLLTKSEVFLLECIRSDSLSKENSLKYEEIVLKDALAQKLFVKAIPIKIKHGMLKTILAFVISLVGLYVVSLFVKNGVIIETSFYVLLFIYVIFSIFYQFVNNFSDRYAYYKTPNGKEIANKLNGLNNFLKDFSRLNEKDKNAIKLWDEYLIYSMIFGQNEQVINDLIKYFKDVNDNFSLIKND